MRHHEETLIIRPRGRMAPLPAALLLVLAATTSAACAPPAPAGRGALGFTGTVDRTAVLVGGDGLVRTELIVRAPDAPPRAPQRVPTDLVVVLDRSGSMSGAKIEDAKSAVRELLALLSDEDRFALVTYASDARVDVPLSAALAPSRSAWSALVATLAPSTSTNISAGLDLGMAELARQPRAGRAARLILISDGLANQGDATHEGLVARARSAARAERVVSAVGVGLDFDEQLMTAIADAGTGNFTFIEEGMRLAGTFRGELESARETVATAVAIAIRPEAGIELVDAAGHPVEWAANEATIRLGSLSASQERRIWLTFRAAAKAPGEQALASVVLTCRRDGRPVRVPLAGLPRIAFVGDRASYVASFDRQAWGRSVAAEEYRALQQSVAKAVKEGDRSSALRHIEGFVVLNSAMNADVQSPEVARALDEAKRLQAQVDDAFTGADQAGKQKLMSKQQWASGQAGRRAGAAKQAP